MKIRIKLKNLFYKFSVYILAVAAITLAFAGSTIAFADGAPAGTPSGDRIGESGVFFSFDAQTGTLTLSGSGEMPDFSAAADTPWYSSMPEIKKLVVGEGIENIGAYAFFKAVSLETIELPATLKKIGAEAFYACAVKDLTLPEGITDIGNFAFRQSPSLEDVTIPASLKNLGSGIFYGCRALKSYNVAAGNTSLKSVDSVLYSADGKTLIAYPAALVSRIFRVPAGVGKIGDYAFYGASDVGHVYICEGVTEIGSYAFVDAVSLRNIALPSSLLKIGDAAFRGCSSVRSITLCKGAEKIESIGTNAFSNCTRLSNIYFCGTEEEYKVFSGIKLALFCAALPDSVAANVTSGRVPVSFNVNYEGMKLDVTYVKDGESRTDHYTVFAGLPYSVETPAIDGYKADAAVIEGNMGGKNVEATVTYSPMVFYLDIIYRLDNGLIVGSYNVAYGYGEEFDVPTAPREGYTPDAEKVSGKILGNMHITVTYKSNSGSAELPGEMGVKPSGSSAAREIKTALDPILFTVIAVLSASLAILAVFCFVSLKRKNKE